MAEPVDIDQELAAFEERMAKAVRHTEEEFATVRTGRAQAALLDGIVVEYYGELVPLRQLASVSTPDPHTLVVSPYDRAAMAAMERAIRDSDLGVNPTNDGSVIRIAIQPLTEERRKELVKVVRKRAEEGRVAIRAVRRQAKQHFEALERQGSLTKDDLVDVERSLDRLTARYVGELDRALEVKERDLLEV
jgi:ribosome recycling factor